MKSVEWVALFIVTCVLIISCSPMITNHWYIILNFDFSDSLVGFCSGVVNFDFNALSRHLKCSFISSG